MYVHWRDTNNESCPFSYSYFQANSTKNKTNKNRGRRKSIFVMIGSRANAFFHHFYIHSVIHSSIAIHSTLLYRDILLFTQFLSFTIHDSDCIRVFYSDLNCIIFSFLQRSCACVDRMYIIYVWHSIFNMNIFTIC